MQEVLLITIVVRKKSKISKAIECALNKFGIKNELVNENSVTRYNLFLITKLRFGDFFLIWIEVAHIEGLALLLIYSQFFFTIHV